MLTLAELTSNFGQAWTRYQQLRLPESCTTLPTIQVTPPLSSLRSTNQAPLFTEPLTLFLSSLTGTSSTLVQAETLPPSISRAKQIWPAQRVTTSRTSYSRWPVTLPLASFNIDDTLPRRQVKTATIRKGGKKTSTSWLGWRRG